jgi:MurNAc alpha-1-phosphate uridylyltransferase
MKAMVFAAGFGTRLGELTKSTPKCLVPLGNDLTMLDHVISRLIDAKVTSVVINIHHLGDQIKEHVAKRHNFGIDIQFSNEDIILGTGGGLKKARWFFDDKPFILHNSDVFSSINLSKMVEAHKSSNALATLAVMDRPTKRPLLMDDSNKLVGFGSGTRAEKISKVTGTIKEVGFCGVQVIDPKYFLFLDKFDGEFSTIPAFFAAAKNGELVQGFKVDSRTQWIDMGTPDDLEKVRKIVKTKGLKPK